MPKTLPRAARREGRKTLKKVLSLFGSDGQGWTRMTLDNGHGQYCLIGAVRKADGPGENVALAAIEKVIARRSDFPKYAGDRVINIFALKPYPTRVFSFNDRSYSFTTIRRIVEKAIRVLGTD